MATHIIHSNADIRGVGGFSDAADFLANAPNPVTSGEIEIGVLCEAIEDDLGTTGLVFGSSRATTAAKHLRLTANDGVLVTEGADEPPTTLGNVRHDGTHDSGARFTYSGSGRAFEISEDYVQIDHIELELNVTSGTSQEAIRVNAAADYVLLDSMLVRTASTRADTDAIYMASDFEINISIINTIMFGFYRAGIHNQKDANGTGNTITEVIHCAAHDLGSAGEVSSGFIRYTNGATGRDHTLRMWSNWAGNTNGGYRDLSDGAAHNQRNGPSGTNLWTGTHNSTPGTDDDIWSPKTGFTDYTQATDGVDDTSQSSGNYLVITNEVNGSEDFTPRSGAGNLILEGGADLDSYSPRDPRVANLLTLDIKGNDRLNDTPDLGPIQFSTQTPPGGGFQPRIMMVS
jgi:hypothetical protein